MVKLNQTNSNSRIFPKQINVTDMTNESAYNNITNDDLHISLSKYNFNGVNLLDHTGSEVIDNTTICGGGIV